MTSPSDQPGVSIDDELVGMLKYLRYVCETSDAA